MEKKDGRRIAIEFSESLIGDVTVGNDTAFTITFSEYNMVPGGSLSKRSINPESVYIDEELGNKILVLELSSGNQQCLQVAVGDVIVSYAGGNLQGVGGMVPNFSMIFRPEDVAYEGHQHDIEHIDVDMDCHTNLVRLYHRETYFNEHIDVYADAITSLIHVDDI